MSRQVLKLYKRYLLVILIFVCSAVFFVPVSGQTILSKKQTKNYLDKISAYEISKVQNPTYGSVGGEWLIIGLARYGSLTDEYLNIYAENLKKEIENKKGILSEVKYTEYARVVLAITAINENAENFDGYNMVQPLAELDNILKTGISGTTFSLLALDSGNYDEPKPKEDYTGNVTTRQKLINVLLKKQLDEGGWAYAGNKSDVDMTAMVIQALSLYYEQNDVKQAVDKGLDFLSKEQLKSGAFKNTSAVNCESTAQVLLAMASMDIDICDKRFVKGNNTILDGLMQFYNGGGFRHTMDGLVNQMATEQAMYALTAYYRQLKDDNGLYNMTDAGVNAKTNKKVTYKVETKNKKRVKKQGKTSEKKSESPHKTIKSTVESEESSRENSKSPNKSKNNSKTKSSKKTENDETENIDNTYRISSSDKRQNVSEETGMEDKADENKEEKGPIVIFIIVIVVILTGLAAFTKKKNKLIALLLVICISVSGCGGKESANKIGKCTIEVECSTILKNEKQLVKELRGHIPEDGIILEKQQVDIMEGDSVYDILSRTLEENNILMETSFTAKSAYVEGIDNIYEFSCGELSGWMYSVNGVYVEKSCSDYTVNDGDVIRWRYTCDLGEDIKQ